MNVSPWCWSRLVLVTGLLVGCDPSLPPGDININSRVQAADGLDLRAVGQLLKDSSNAEEFERRLNEPGSINNLDLNEDGKVDFIHVTEYGADQDKGFSLTVQPEVGQTQEIATIEIERPAEGRGSSDVTVRGNEQVYGPGHHYHYDFPLGSMLLMSYLFAPHPLYVSPFGFGLYPAYYGAGFAPISPARYVVRTGEAQKNAPAAQPGAAKSSTLVSPNQGKSASSGIRASLRNPSQSQKAFSARSPGPVSSRGFASRARGSTGAASAPRPPARSRLGGGFRSRR